jgi:hypothetical protein
MAEQGRCIYSQVQGFFTFFRKTPSNIRIVVSYE